MSILAFIPARGGSQRVAHKNIRPLGGKPLLAYTVAAARQAGCIDRVVVSTDSPEIAAVARSCGAETPFLRPAEIAQAQSTEMEFFRHALEWFATHERYRPELIVLLYPTSPFRTAASVARAVQTMLAHPEADSLRSVRLCAEHPNKMWVMENGYLRPFVRGPEPDMHTWSYQRLPVVYIQNASIYITRPATIERCGTPTGDVVVPFVMDERESFDINTPLDFELAELLLAAHPVEEREREPSS